MTGRCGTCKHWKFTEPDWEFETMSFGNCKRIIHRNSITDERNLGVERTYEDDCPWEKAAEEALKKSQAFVVDASGYHAALRTCADFGCVLYEEKAT